MIKIKTDQELLIELRNRIAGRIVECKANLNYWLKMFQKSKKDSQERVDAKKSMDINEENIKKDKVFLESIDLMLKKEIF
jgi:hypothetical protein